MSESVELTAVSGERAAWQRWLPVAALAATVAAVFWLHAAVLAPFLLSLTLAYVLEPGVRWLKLRGIPRPAGAALCLLVGMLLATLLILLVVPIVLELAPRLRTQLPELAATAWHQAVPWLTQFGVKVPHELADLRPMLAKLFDSHGEQWMATALSSLRVGGSLVLTATGLMVLVPVLAFYWLLDWPRLLPRAASLVPWRWRETVGGFSAEADLVLGQYLRGQILVMLVLAVYYSVGLLLFGFDLALPIGVFTGLAVFIPYLGFGLGLLLALLAGLLQFSGTEQGLLWPMLGVAVVYGSGQLIESFLLTPRLVGQRIGLHPIGVILVLMLFGQWMGFVGVLMALPLSALLMVVLRRGLASYRASRFYQAGSGAVA